MKQRRISDYCLECSNIIIVSLRVFVQLLYGSWKVLRLNPPRVTFFGGARWKLNEHYAKEAYLLAKKLVKLNIAVMTGGGPGIMQAGNCGAASLNKESDSTSLGIGVENLPGEKGINTCAQEQILLDNFFVRKWLLINYAIGFVIFPGGFGTLDEFCTVLTLIQTKKIDKVPVILIGKEYWETFLNWVVNSAVKNKTISMEETKLITVTDDIEEATMILFEYAQKYKKK